MYLVEVVLPLPLFKTFYYISDEFLIPGIRVVVPFRSGRLIGIVKSCVEAEDNSLKQFSFELKEVDEAVDASPLVPPELFKFLDWVSDYYLTPIGLVFQTALPPGAFRLPQKRIFLTSLGKEALRKGELPEFFASIKSKGVSVRHFLRKFKLSHSQLLRFQKKGYIKAEYIFPEVSIPKEKFVKLKSWNEELSEELKEVLKYVKEKKEVPEKILKQVFSPYKVKKLLKEGYLERVFYPKLKRIYLSWEVPDKVELTSEQKRVSEKMLELFAEGGFKPVVLFGVTGSGKSFVYLELVKKVLERGKRVLILVPEIALTTYMEVLMMKNFEGGVALLHSGLSAGQRFAEWNRILSGEAKVVVGTRSAIFAPLKDIGLIVVDEEHDHSYKEENLSCRYNARDLALVRARLEGIPVVLGSATPSVKTFYFAKKGKYSLFTLKERPFTKLPKVTIIRHYKPWLFSRDLKDEVEKELLRRKSVFLYLNRRGYSPFVVCEDCGYVWMCPNCEVPLTFHKREGVFKCHYCEFEVSSTTLCPNCKGGKFKFKRAGTEKIEEEVKKLFPGIEVIRLDRDAVSTDKKLVQVMRRIYDPEPKIIVGTQMGVHGHNFPGVDMVGVLKAEEGLFMPFYKAAERTFALLVQACGRAGRKHQRGKVFFQTSIPEHYAIKFAALQDYEKFFEKELELRKKFGFPPFVRLGLIRIEGVKEERVEETITELYLDLKEFVSTKGLDVTFSGPSPSPFYKLKGVYRWQLIVKSKSANGLRTTMARALNLKLPAGMRIFIDLDPEEVL